MNILTHIIAFTAGAYLGLFAAAICVAGKDTCEDCELCQNHAKTEQDSKDHNITEKEA